MADGSIDTWRRIFRVNIVELERLYSTRNVFGEMMLWQRSGVCGTDKDMVVIDFLIGDVNGNVCIY